MVMVTPSGPMDAPLKVCASLLSISTVPSGASVVSVPLTRAWTFAVSQSSHRDAAGTIDRAVGSGIRLGGLRT